MLKFVRALFLKPKKNTEMGFKGVENWLKDEETQIMERINNRLNERIGTFNSILATINDKILMLKNAELQNPDITQKEKDYMEGNRECYINAIGNWLCTLTPNSNLKIMKEFCIDFDNKLEELNQKTLRSYTILQEFFSKETSKIAEGVKELENNVIGIRKIIKDEKAAKIAKIKSDYDAINILIGQKESLLMDLEVKKQELGQLISHKNSLSVDLDKLRGSSEHANFKKLQEEKNKIYNEIKERDFLLFRSFSSIERALKKYLHLKPESEEIASLYLESPLKALSNDSELKILGILKGLNNLLEKEEIVFDLGKKIKIYSEIARLSEANLRDSRKFYNESVAKINEIESSIKDAHVLKKEEEMSGKILYNEKEISEAESAINKINKYIQKISIEQPVRKLQEDIGDFSGNNVSIRMLS